MTTSKEENGNLLYDYKLTQLVYTIVNPVYRVPSVILDVQVFNN